MAYRRRYLSGQSATTVAIAEGAITSDKIVDKAVTQPKIDDDAVTTEKIATGAVQTEDIKDGGVKTVDLGNGSVTTAKIADQAVTVAKLESSIQGIARPLTPGVATAEIADLAVTEGKLAANAVAAAKIKAGAVDATKLAGDAVETAKIKNLNVTGAKLAAGSVDNTKIIADAVRGTEIQNGAVSVNKLGTDAVETVKIKDDNVSAPKIQTDAVITRTILDGAVTDPKLYVAALARRHIESKDTRVLTHFEEFGGLFVSDKWQRIATDGYFIGPNGKDGVHLLTNNTNGDLHRMNWGGQGIGTPADIRPVMNTYISARHASLDYLTNIIGLWYDADNHIIFIAEDLGGATPNWKAKCRTLGAETLVDTGVPITAAIQLLAIEVVDAGHVKFYIDGIEEVEITTNIPDTFVMEPWLEVITRENDHRWIKVGYASILADRPDYV